MNSQHKVVVANLPGVCVEKDGTLRHLVKAGSRWPMTVGMSKSVDYYPFPFWMSYTSALLKRELSINVKGIDGVVLDMTAEELFAEIKREQPAILLTELVAVSLEEDMELLKQIKEDLGCIVIAAGSHATADYQNLLKQHPCLDYILIGEYELTAKELVSSLIEQKTQGISDIPGIAFRDAIGNISATKPRDMLRDLDYLPFPDREDFPATIYPDFAFYAPCINILSSRGCPAGCVYCTERHVLYNSPQYRMRKPEKVVDEMEYCIRKYGAKQFYFDDQSFVVNKKHVMGICKELLRRKTSILWTCMGDAMFVDYDMLEIMANAGCIGMKFGVESANPEILRNIDKPLDLEKVRKVVKWCKKLMIKTHATFCIGLPGETPDTIQKSIKFMEELNADTAQVSKVIPYPGTPMYQWAMEHNHLSTTDLSQFDGAGKAILSSPELSCDELDRWHGIFSRKVARKKILQYLKEPVQCISILREMWRRKGFLSVARSFVTFVERAF
jgi:anaerobic magnesium-protoporphyrin IX monomethyl ester cyclase